MKKLLTTLAVFQILSACLFSQLTLKVDIAGIRNNKGKIMLQLFDENQKVIAERIGDIVEEGCSFTFTGLNRGKYAVRFYHDENMNRNMETNLAGKPKEGYGFSNNVRGRFSMPPFDEWLFDLDENRKITINTVY